MYNLFQRKAQQMLSAETRKHSEDKMNSSQISFISFWGHCACSLPNFDFCPGFILTFEHPWLISWIHPFLFVKVWGFLFYWIFLL